jgi:ubiquinone/menaquinone biosynthesis C-methylase UbiE
MLLDMAVIAEGDRLLDVACGSGLVTFRAAARIGAEGQVIGTDISDQMVATARESASRQALTNVRFERMDAEDLQFEDASFDIVLCALGLMYVPDPEKALREFHRVLRPGGKGRGRRLGAARQMRLGRAVPDRRRSGAVGGLPHVLWARDGVGAAAGV